MEEQKRIEAVKFAVCELKKCTLSYQHSKKKGSLMCLVTMNKLKQADASLVANSLLEIDNIAQIRGDL